MPRLDITIRNAAGLTVGVYSFECVDRPGIDVEHFDAEFTLGIIRSVAERGMHLSDFPRLDSISLSTVTFDQMDPPKAARLENVNEVWFEVENLMLGARLNFATAQAVKVVEDGFGQSSPESKNLTLSFHLDKMERFHLAVFELARVEDLIVRAVYNFFGTGFMDVDESKDGWEKRLTWDRMKDALNMRGKPDCRCSDLSAMREVEFQKLIGAVRGYRTEDVLKLTNYRDRRTHRVAPSVDHPELGATLNQPQAQATGVVVTGIGVNAAPEFTFQDLYGQAKFVYCHLCKMLAEISEIIHA